MDKHIKKPAQLDPVGAEGVPVDAPGNTAPAISPQAVSRMHRAEDDDEAFHNSPEYSNEQNMANDDRVAGERWTPGAPGSGQPDSATRGLSNPPSAPQEPNPAHGVSRGAGTPRQGSGKGAREDQPETKPEARQPGADSPPKE